MSDIVVGIDFGTTNSCVALHLNDTLRILENNDGGRTTPSFIFIPQTGNSVIVGKYAKRMADFNPENAIYELKRLIGRKYDDPYVKNNLRDLLFPVKNINGEPTIVIEGKTQIIKKTPHELCSVILSKLKSNIEHKLGYTVTKAVITVPAYFSTDQRQATLCSARSAGFEVLKLLNEPTAAAYTYYNEHENFEKEGHFLVYDLGGGTFDVAILCKKLSVINVVGVDGDTHLGGHDFDNLLVDYACDYLKNEYNYIARDNRRNMRRLRNACEEAKEILSNIDDTTIVLTGFISNDSDIEIPISKEQFENMIDGLLQKTIEIMDRCLKKANLSINDIQEIIMSGGSTRIPKVHKLIENHFKNKSINKFINPDECVAEGAAIQAALLSTDPRQEIKRIKVTEVVPLSIGIGNFVDLMTFLIKRNTPIPTSTSTQRLTVYNNQTNMIFSIYEGERSDARKNNFLGNLEISDLTPAPPGDCSVEVTVNIDQNGIITITAKEHTSGKTKDFTFNFIKGSRSEMQVKTIGEDRENEEEDRNFIRFAELKGYVIKYCIRAMYNFETKNLVDEYKRVYDKCSEVSRFVKSMELKNYEDVLRYHKELTTLCSPIAKKHNFSKMP